MSIQDWNLPQVLEKLHMSWFKTFRTKGRLCFLLLYVPTPIKQEEGHLLLCLMVSSFYRPILTNTEVIWASWDSLSLLSTLRKYQVGAEQLINKNIDRHYICILYILNIHTTLNTYVCCIYKTYLVHLFVSFLAVNGMLSRISKLGPICTTSCKNYSNILACGIPVSYFLCKYSLLSDIYQQKDYTNTHHLRDRVLNMCDKNHNLAIKIK
jgi:hypothetical protein